MKELLKFAWDVLLFRHQAYIEHVGRADVLRRGLLLLVVVTLLAGLLSFVVNAVERIRTPVAADPRAAARAALDEMLASIRQYGGATLPPDFEQMITSYALPGMEIGFAVSALPTPLPRFFGALFTAWGAFLSQPFDRLSGWLSYTLWVMLVAKLLGGKGKVAQVLGATSLFALPHILNLLGVIPCLGSLLGLVATLWGIAIYVKALAVASDFGIGKALVAALLPGVVLALFMGLSALVAFLPLILGNG